MSAHDDTHGPAGAAMWAGIAGAALLLIVLLARGWGRSAWGVAAGVLLLVCVGVCVWAAVTGERSARTVRAEIERLAETRRRAAGEPRRRSVERDRAPATRAPSAEEGT